MYDLIVALGLVLVIEGLMIAAFPNAVRRALESIDRAPDTPLRIAGVIGAVVGLLIVWVIRG